MCGIVGFLGHLDKQAREESVSHMVSTISHRGPDDEGILSVDDVTLGHRRLSVIDLSEAGHQPMISSDGRYAIVYNGEVYNFKDIKPELSDYPFRSQTDTEVILAAYCKWGKECLKKFNGMFAFAIWDRESKELFVARDRLGIKPLYYYQDNGLFLFSSEIRSLLASDRVLKKINRQALYQYLSYQTVLTPNTLIKDVMMLEAGHYMYINKAGKEISSYWDITQIKNNNENRSYGEVCKDVKGALYKSVEKRLVSDVPMGAFLSGGIDSSALVGVYSDISAHRVSTFSVEFDDSIFNESHYAQQIANKFKTDHHVVPIRVKEVLKKLPEFLGSYDHPSADGLNSYIISQAVKKEGITVALSGLGGDEIFAGYPIFSAFKKGLFSRWITQCPLALRSILANMGYRIKPSFSMQKLKTYLSSKSVSFQEFYNLFHTFLNSQQIFEVANTHYNDHHIKKVLEGVQEKSRSNYQLSAISIAEMNFYLQDILLRDTDQMSMQHALEVRVPFLDHELVDLVLGIQDKMKLGRTSKKLLVDSLEGLLPREIVDRKKQGFVFPIEKWMKQDLKEFCGQSIKSLSKRDFFVEDGVRGYWKNFLDGDKSVSWTTFWSWVVLERWLEKVNIDE